MPILDPEVYCYDDPPYPMPMNSKLKEDLPIFSPPSKTIKQPVIPEFIRLLEPKIFEQLQTKSSSRKDHQEKVTGENNSIAAAVVKHKLSVMHLSFPGKCHFVSFI